jgi:hypothetical protein
MEIICVYIFPPELVCSSDPRDCGANIKLMIETISQSPFDRMFSNPGGFPLIPPFSFSSPLLIATETFEIILFIY